MATYVSLDGSGGGGGGPASPSSPTSTSSHSRRTLGALGVAVVSFAAVAGGPYGIEPAVGSAGGLPTLLTLVVVAVCWACTQGLMVAELSTMLPSNAGYIGWVLHGLGPRWGFVNAWVCTLQQTLNIPLYAVLACSSLEQLIGTLPFFAEYGVKLALVCIVAFVNIMGVQAVERVTGLMVILVQTPFVLMPILWAARGRAFQWGALQGTVQGWNDPSSVAAFLSTICWNLQGWNVIGNVAGEVHTPNRNIPLGVALAVLLVTLNYVWPLTFTIPMSPPPSPADDPGVTGARWGTGYFVGLAAKAAPELGVWAGVAAVLSCLSNFIPVLATSARALQAAAKIGMVPSRVASEWLESEDPKRGVPVPATFSILFVVLWLMVLSFETLVTTQILLALVGLCLQFAAFIRLKYTAPDAPRPYAVPYGKVGAWVLAAPFFFLAALIAYSNVSGSLQNWVSSIAVATSTVGLYAVGDLWWVKGGHYDKERVDRVLQEAHEGGEEEETTELLPFLAK